MLLASGARDASLCVWDLQRRQCTLRITGHKAPVSGCAFVDASTLVSSSLDGSLRVMDLASGGRTTRTLTEHDGVVSGVVALDPSSQTLASCSGDFSLRVWDLRLAIPCVHVLFDHEAAVYGLVAMRHDPLTLVSASWDRTIKIWTLRMPPPSNAPDGGRCVRTLRGHTDAVRAIVQLDDQHVASAGWDCTIRLWGVSQSEQEPAADATATAAVDDSFGVLTGHSAWIYTLAYLPEQQLIVSGSGDRTIRLSSPATMQCTSVLTGHENTIWNVAALPGAAPAVSDTASPSSSASATSTGARSSGQFVSGGADAQIRLWDTVGKSCTRISGGHAPDVPVHALDVWPSLRDDPAARTPLRLPVRHAKDSVESGAGNSGGSNSSSSSSALTAAVPSAAAAPSDPARASSPRMYADELERHGGQQEWHSQIEHEVHTKPADSLLQHSALQRAAHVTFAVAPCAFNQPDAGAEAAPSGSATLDAPDTAAAETASANSSSSSPLSATTATSAAAAPAAAAAAAADDAPSDLLSQLSELRDEAVRFYDDKSLVRAEQILLEMVALVERQQDGSATNSPPHHQQQTLPHTAITSLLFYLYHDLSLVAFTQCAYAAALRYVTQCLSFYTDDDEEEGEGEDEDGVDGSSGASVASKRLVDQRRVLLDQRREAIEEIPDMIPTQLVLPSVQLHLAGSVRSSSSAAAATPGAALASTASPSAAAHAKPAAARAPVTSAATPATTTTGSVVLCPLTPPSLYLSLQLRRFWSAFMVRDVYLSQRLCASLLALVEDNDQRRESALDEIEAAVLDQRVHQREQLPLHSLYAHLLYVYHADVLVAFVHRKMEEINRCKEKGNQFYSATAPAADDPAPSSSSSSGPSYGSAASQYARGIQLAKEVEELLRDATTCPSFAWFEVLAAQIPPPADAIALRQGRATPTQSQSAAGSFLLDLDLVPPFSLHHLSFLRATLHSNLAMAALKCSQDEFAALGLPPPSSHPAAARRGLTVLAAPVPPEQLRAASAQRACEEGIEVMELLCVALKPLREAVTAAKARSRGTARPSAPPSSLSDADRNVYLENLALGASLPSLSSCSALQSKLYFRHGAAALERGLDDVAEASFALSLRLQPDDKVRREIERRKKQRKGMETKSGSAAVTPVAPKPQAAVAPVASPAAVAAAAPTPVSQPD